MFTSVSLPFIGFSISLYQFIFSMCLEAAKDSPNIAKDKTESVTRSLLLMESLKGHPWPRGPPRAAEGQDPGPYLATPSFQRHFSIHNGAPLCKLGAILRFSCVNGEFREEQVLQLPWMMRTTHCGWLTEHNVFCEQQRCSLW